MNEFFFFKTIGRTMRIVFVISSIFMVGTACNEKADYQDEFQDRILLQYLIQPQPAPGEKCQGYYQSMSECLSQSQDQRAQTDALNLARYAYLAITRTPPRGADLNAVCGEILSTDFYSQFSERYKDCYLDCQAKIWKDLSQSQTTCQAPFLDLYNSRLESNRAKECLQKCGQVNNTTEF